MGIFQDKIQALQKELDYFKKIDEEYDRNKALIKVGTIIFDTGAEKYAKVIHLKQGSIDFGTDYLDGSCSRGYSFLSGNWRIATEDELKGINN